MTTTATTDPYDHAVWFYQEVVDPTVAEFLNNPDDLRLGCLSCIALSSLVEHYFHARRDELPNQNVQTLRRSLAEFPAVEIVFDVANATKHVVPARNRSLDFKNVTTMPLDNDTYGTEVDDDVNLGNVKLPIGSELMVPVGDDLYCLLSAQVEFVDAMWRTKLRLPPRPTEDQVENN